MQILSCSLLETWQQFLEIPFFEKKEKKRFWLMSLPAWNYPLMSDYRDCTGVPMSANLSMGMFAMIRAQYLNLLRGFEWGYQFHPVEDKMM